jgi:hypothetical protein
MTDTGRVPPTSAGRMVGDQPPPHTDLDDWSGWITFAGVIMILLGAFEIIEGLVALFNPSYFLVGPQGLIVHVDYSVWGWVHLLLGVLVLGAGFGVMAGRVWARMVGVALALVSAVVNLAFLAAHPIWSVLVIAIDVMVIYALVTDRRPAR